MKERLKVVVKHMFILSLLFLVLYPASVQTPEFPLYRVVLDPGHGGINRIPIEKHGDRFDTLSGKYLYGFREGASRGTIFEHQIMYEISVKVENILKDCAPGGDFQKFQKVLEKYADEPAPRIHIVTMISRPPSIDAREAKNGIDPNAQYRMFDYYDKTGKRIAGRLSRINAFKPHLVVTLHCAGLPAAGHDGMCPVIAPSYDLFVQGLHFLQKKKNDPHFFLKSKYNNWFKEGRGRSDFDWFLNDTMLYFNGYPLQPNRKINDKNFKGYRYNMLTWAYADKKDWEKEARQHKDKSQYAINYYSFVPNGSFWDRERSVYEKYRRDGGLEGFGGDNAYASYELIRFMLLSLYINKGYNASYRPSRSFVSAWIVPVHVNAINAFIELGYLRKNSDVVLLTKKQNELAEGIAVGIYSLFTGIKLKKFNFNHLPKSAKIDYKKYNISEKKSYFDVVIQ